jgi:hypothetical protein
VTTAGTVLTIAGLTLREASRRRVLLALAVLTVVLLLVSAWGFSRLASESGAGELTSGEARLTASIVLNLVMFGFSLIAALGTAFLAGPTLAGETESGIALAVLALLAAQTVVLLTLAVLLSTLVSPMASGVVAVGLFGATWVAGVVGGIGASLDNDAVERVGTVSRVILPTDGLWRGAMHAFQDPSAFSEFGGADAQAFPFLSVAPLTVAYLAWAALWVAMVWGVAAASFLRKDL